MRGHFSPIGGSVPPPHFPPVRRKKWQKSAIFGIFSIFAPTPKQMSNEQIWQHLVPVIQRKKLETGLVLDHRTLKNKEEAQVKRDHPSEVKLCVCVHDQSDHLLVQQYDQYASHIASKRLWYKLPPYFQNSMLWEFWDNTDSQHFTITRTIATFQFLCITHMTHCLSILIIDIVSIFMILVDPFKHNTNLRSVYLSPRE